MVDERHEKAAKQIFEVFKGKGTWAKASSDERSKARHALRLALATVGSASAAPTKPPMSRW